MSLPIPIYPSDLVIESSKLSFLPLIILMGKKVALPKLFFFKYIISFFATCSVLVITLEIAAPKAISKAVSYCLSTLKTSPKTFVSSAPSIFSSFMDSISDLTDLLYPS